MENNNNSIKKSNLAIFLNIWQIIELLGLLFLIPLCFFAGIFLTGDSSTLYNFINSYILPSIGLFLIVKIIVTIAFFKSKRWALYFNFIQNVILSVLTLVFAVITVFAGRFPILLVFFLFLFLFIARANLKCLRHPFYQRISKKINDNIS